MTTKYFSVQAATTTLSTKGRNISGNITEIMISNHHISTSQTITLYLDATGSATTYIILSTVIPAQTSLVLNDKTMLKYDGASYHLKLTTATAADTTIIVK